MNNLGVLDFEVIIIIIMMILDIIVGTIDHDFYSKDANSGGAIKGLINKVAIASFLIFLLLIIHLNDWDEFKGVSNIINYIRSGADAVTVMLIYFELASVLAHMENITGIDFSKIPAVKQELDQKALKAHNYHKNLEKMKEESVTHETTDK